MGKAKLILGGLFAIHVTSAGLLFTISMVLARYLEPSDFGVYEYVEGWLEIFIAISLFGFDRLLISQISSETYKEKWGKINSLLKLSIKFITSWSIFLAFFIIFLIGLIKFSSFSNLDNKIEVLFWPIVIGAIGIPFRAFIKRDQAILHGMQYIVTGHVSDFLLRPIGFLFVILFLYYGLSQRVQVKYIFLIQLVIVVLTGIFSHQIKRRKIVKSIQSSVFEPGLGKQYLLRAIPLVLLTAATILSLRLGTILLGYLADFAMVARYGIILKLSAVTNLLPLTIMKMMAPKISIAHASGRKAKLNDILKKTMMLCGLSALIIGTVIVLSAHKLLALYGSAYTSEATVNALILMCVVNIILAPLGVFFVELTMVNAEWFATIAYTVSLIATPFLFFYLVPQYHLFGAVVATGVSFAIHNVMSMLFGLSILTPPCKK